MKDFKLARHRAKVKILFFWHLATYVVVTAALIIINNVIVSEHQWWIWPAIFWGLGILAHFLRSFVFDNRLEQKFAEKEMENIEKEEE